jgi:hypothetical protein
MSINLDNIELATSRATRKEAAESYRNGAAFKAREAAEANGKYFPLFSLNFLTSLPFQILTTVRAERRSREAEERFCRRICRWTNQADPAQQQTADDYLEIRVQENISEDVVSRCATKLTAAGYIVTRDGDKFRIALP